MPFAIKIYPYLSKPLDFHKQMIQQFDWSRQVTSFLQMSSPLAIHYSQFHESNCTIQQCFDMCQLINRTLPFDLNLMNKFMSR